MKIKVGIVEEQAREGEKFPRGVDVIIQGDPVLVNKIYDLIKKEKGLKLD